MTSPAPAPKRQRTASPSGGIRGKALNAKLSGSGGDESAGAPRSPLSARNLNLNSGGSNSNGNGKNIKLAAAASLAKQHQQQQPKRPGNASRIPAPPTSTALALSPVLPAPAAAPAAPPALSMTTNAMFDDASDDDMDFGGQQNFGEWLEMVGLEGPLDANGGTTKISAEQRDELVGPGRYSLATSSNAFSTLIS
jgi:hypothetical protein